MRSCPNPSAGSRPISSSGWTSSRTRTPSAKWSWRARSTCWALYRGVSLDRRGVSDSAEDVDYVFLYRRPILDYWCETGEDLMHIVRHVLVHEIGHHFGLSDEDMEAIEAKT